MVLSCVFMVILALAFILSTAVFPLALGGLILLTSFVVVAVVMAYQSVFYGVVLLLVFIGGLLVAFGYATALSSNPIFGFMSWGGSDSSAKKAVISLLWLGIGLVLFLFGDFSVGLEEGVMVFMFQKSGSIFVNFDWGSVVVFLGVLLFVNMVAVVSVCSHYVGALVEFSRRGKFFKKK